MIILCRNKGFLPWHAQEGLPTSPWSSLAAPIVELHFGGGLTPIPMPRGCLHATGHPLMILTWRSGFFSSNPHHPQCPREVSPPLRIRRAGKHRFGSLRIATSHPSSRSNGPPFFSIAEIYCEIFKDWNQKIKRDSSTRLIR